MKLISVFVLCLSFLTSCGYHFAGTEPIFVSVPYVQGDFEGELTDAIIAAISKTSQFRYAHGKGDWILKAKVLDSHQERIGFRYDRRPGEDGKRRKNIVGIENRKEIEVEVQVINATTDAVVWGPHVIRADATYDYTDPNVLREEAVFEGGTLVPSVAFSLGQLDSVGAAGEDSTYPIYQHLARKIVEGLLLRSL